MSKKISILVVLLVSCGTAYADSVNKICLLSGTPSSNVTYKTLQTVKAGKNSYGSVNDVIPLLISRADKLGANAIINYNGSQRFGFWPWRFIRPVATGLAVTWVLPENVTCESLGGTYNTKLQGSLISGENADQAL